MSKTATYSWTIFFISFAVIIQASEAKAILVNSNSIVVDNIEYYMQTNKTVYNLGENVEMLYRVTNVGTEDVLFWFNDQVQYHFEVKQNVTIIWFYPKAGLPAGSVFVLQPNEYKEYTESWDMINENGTGWIPDDDYPASPGNYNVVGSLSLIALSSGYKDKYVPVSVQIEILPRTVYVDPNGSADYTSIQPAIDDANNGDIIIVNPGLYEESINFLGKNIILQGSGHNNLDAAAETIIDGGVIFRGTEEPNCVLTGFKINTAIAGYDYNFDYNRTHATISYCLLDECMNGCVPSIFACDGMINNCLIKWPETVCEMLVPTVGDCYGLIKNCTIVSRYNIIELWLPGTCTIENSIIYGTEQTVYLGDDSALNITYSNITGGLDGIFGTGTVYWGPGNIDVDPCFVELDHWDDEEDRWGMGDYHLQSAAGRFDPNINDWVTDANISLCIDAGNPGCPLADEPNDANNVRINMGAYGGTAYASKTPSSWRSIADLTNNWIVDVNDLDVFVNYWLDNAQCLPGDLDRSGSVNFSDFAIFADNWLEPKILNFADYWPFAVGNRWVSEAIPDAGFILEITDRFLVNGFEVWEFTNELGSFAGGFFETLYYVYVNDALHATENPVDIFSLPQVTGDLQPQYPQTILIGRPVNIPNLGLVRPLQGTLSSVLTDTPFTVEDFPLGDQPDVLALVPIGSQENIVVFARDMGPMLIYHTFIAQINIAEP
ncbi:MAG: BsuPI-related putative proteinase inhibitor [Planctomycetota bacterium]|jgi:hypothetical protein